MAKTKKKEKSVDELVKAYFEADAKLCEKYGISKRILVRFPNKKDGKASWYGRILLVLLKWNGAILDTEFSIKRQ